jgi:eukaryotic-like serine/threonine-protein kinase
VVTGTEEGAALGAESVLLHGLRSILVAPLQVEDRLLGIVYLDSQVAKGIFTPADVGVVAALTNYLAISLEASQAQRLAAVDDLTGLASRRHFFVVGERMRDDAARTGRSLTGLMLDIDRFKLVNDGYGHPTGDDVIRAVAGRLAGELRGADVIGRYGGEEFAILLCDGDPAVAERLRQAIAASPVDSRSGPIATTISIGLAALGLGDDEVGALLARADQALYQAKHGGRNQVRAAADPAQSP